MGFRYAQPDNEDAFEQMCLRFYRKLWKNESLMLYGKRGESQEGIDIVDPVGLVPRRAVQCKHHEPTKHISPAEIKKEVSQAEMSARPLDTYVIATTAKKSKQAQDVVAKLNSRPDSERKFKVEIHFWEDICQLLGQFTHFQIFFILTEQDLAADVVTSILRDPQVASIAMSFLSAGAEQSVAGSFGEIEALIDGRNFEVASHAIDKFTAAREPSRFPPEDEYKLLRLKGKLAMGLCQFELASQHFLAAYALQPELDQAKHNQVLAHSLMGDSAQALALATRYLADGLVTPQMLCRFIESAPTLEQIQEKMQLMALHLSTNEELNVTLSHKLLTLGDATSAVTAAERALKIAPNSPHANYVAALTAHHSAVKARWSERTVSLQRALRHYNVAVEVARRDRYMGVLAEALTNRASTHALLGDVAEAANDYRAVVALGQRGAYVERAVSFFLHESDYSSAAKLIEFLDKDSTQGKFLIAVTRFNCTYVPNERREHLEQMKTMANEQWPRAVECRFHCVDWALRLNDSAEAASCITDRFRAEHPFQAFTALAWIASESGDTPLTAEYADKALAHISTDVHGQELRLLAHTFMKVKVFTSALDVLQRIAVPGNLNEDMKSLIDCAQHLGRHDLLLRLSRELREAGAQNDKVRRMELRLLERYAPDLGFEVADEFVRNGRSTAYFVAFRNMLAVRLQRLDVVERDPSRLPKPGELEPIESRLVVMPYIVTGMYGEAIKFLYAQLRLHFDEECAHGQFVFCFLKYGCKTSIGTPPGTVLADCAVRPDLFGGDQRWVVIEDEKPSPSRGEFPTGSEMSQCLLGRCVGDVIQLPGGILKPERATIGEIQTKYVRAFQDSLQQFRARFPQTSIIQEFHVGAGADFDPTPIIESIKQRQVHVDECFKSYAAQPWPLHFLAVNLGISQFDVVKAIAQYPTAALNCCQVGLPRFEKAVADGIANQTIVLDLSAIVTLTLVDGWGHLPQHKNYVVSRATSAVVDDWVRHAVDEAGRESGRASITDEGRLVLNETSPEESDARRAECERVKSMIDTHCECRSSSSLPALSPEKRDLYEKAMGFHNLESMSLAKDLGAVLWTDDAALSFVAQGDFGVNVVWTQLALRVFVDAGLGADDYNLVSAKLASWKYQVTIWDAATIIRAGEHAAWDTQAWPFKQCIELIGGSGLEPLDRARIALSALKRLRRSACAELRQSAIVRAFLNAVRNRQSVIWMFRRLDAEFGLDWPSAAFLRAEIKYWFDSNLD